VINRRAFPVNPDISLSLADKIIADIKGQIARGVYRGPANINAGRFGLTDERLAKFCVINHDTIYQKPGPA
jgi:hypothetical protein